MRKYLLIALLLAASVLTIKAQDREDALLIWSAVTVKKSLGAENRWTVGIISEYRHQLHEGVSNVNQYFVRPSVSYKALSWLTLQYQMDFAATHSSGFNWRFIPEVTLSHKIGDFSLAFRQRAMTTWKVAAGKNSTVLRSRAKVDYRIPQTPVSMHFAVEPYWCDFSKNSFAWFQKCRWYAGFNVKLTDNLSFAPQYIYQAYYNHHARYDRRTYDEHAIYMTLAVKL